MNLKVTRLPDRPPRWRLGQRGDRLPGCSPATAYLVPHVAVLHVQYWGYQVRNGLQYALCRSLLIASMDVFSGIHSDGICVAV
jgi:hypothetical protein